MNTHGAHVILTSVVNMQSHTTHTKHLVSALTTEEEVLLVLSFHAFSREIFKGRKFSFDFYPLYIIRRVDI